jgi:hypothetical protein
VGPAGDLTACLDAQCTVCRELGVGDPCAASSDCNPGLTCGGLGCTRECTGAADCIGIGAGGGNAAGLRNGCITVAGLAPQCFPGCATNSDCSVFPGTYCFATRTVDGQSVNVCMGIPDAGTD